MVKSALIAAALLLTVSLSLAAVDNVTPGHAKATVLAKKSKKVYPKLVDINSAKKAELMKLPGVGNAEADKIIAGRPYLTKAHLVTHNVIPAEIYEQFKKQIMAKQK